MSKGHGRVERSILRTLDRERKRGFSGVTTLWLAMYVAGGETLDGLPLDYAPSRSELESVRRALRNLRKQGVVETFAGDATKGHCNIYYALSDERRPVSAQDRLLAAQQLLEGTSPKDEAELRAWLRARRNAPR